MNRPEEYYEEYTGSILIEFQNDVFEWVGGSAEFQALEFDDFYDPDLGKLILDKYDIEDRVYDALEPYFPEYEDEGMYKISGRIEIPYVIMDYRPRYQYQQSGLEDEDELIKIYFDERIGVGNIDISPLKAS